MCKRGTAAALLFCLLLSLFFGAGTVRVYADSARKDFSCDVEFLRQEDDRCTLQVTVANGGKDFSGYVRLVLSPNEKDACAYDTEITLPEKGKKQFTLTVPSSMADLSNDTCEACFLDGKGQELQRMTIKKVFGSTAGGLTMGILSDDYDSLTYLDLGGQPLYIANSDKPVRLIELDKENLESYLDGLYFLVIDRYNVESLGEDKINAIYDWVEKGGWLLIGTGKYAEDTLGGFEDVFSIEAGTITEPGENNHLYTNAMNGYYYMYQDAGVDFSKMAAASFNYLNGMYFDESSENPAVLASIGDGAVAVYACALSDDEFVKGTAYAGDQMLREVTYYSNSYGSRYYDSIDYYGQEALSAIDRDQTNVDFSALMLLIVAYIVLVGPALYFLLRLKKKSEWYWIGAPLLGLVFIGGVYIFGRDIRVANTKVYSVSLQEAGSGRVDTYYEAYRSGTKSWKLLLNDNYEVAGTGFGRGYYYYNNASGDYHYLVQNSGDGLSIGMKPQQNFESGFLYASGRAEPQGQLSASSLKFDAFGNMSGTLKNDTGHDLTYFAVACDDFFAIFSDVKAGESIDFDTDTPTDRCIYHSVRGNGGDIYYNLVGYGRWGRPQYDFVRDKIAAFYIGLELARENAPEGRPVTLAGLVTDAEKTVAGACDEYAYRCLSSYAELEVDAYAAH